VPVRGKPPHRVPCPVRRRDDPEPPGARSDSSGESARTSNRHRPGDHRSQPGGDHGQAPQGSRVDPPGRRPSPPRVPKRTTSNQGHRRKDHRERNDSNSPRQPADAAPRRAPQRAPRLRGTVPAHDRSRSATRPLHHSRPGKSGNRPPTAHSRSTSSTSWLTERLGPLPVRATQYAAALYFPRVRLSPCLVGPTITGPTRHGDLPGRRFSRSAPSAQRRQADRLGQHGEPGTGPVRRSRARLERQLGLWEQRARREVADLDPCRQGAKRGPGAQHGRQRSSRAHVKRPGVPRRPPGH